MASSEIGATKHHSMPVVCLLCILEYRMHLALYEYAQTYYRRGAVDFQLALINLLVLITYMPHTLYKYAQT